MIRRLPILPLRNVTAACGRFSPHVTAGWASLALTPRCSFAGYCQTPVGPLPRGAPCVAELPEKGDAARACLQMSWDPESLRLRKARLTQALTITLLWQGSLFPWEKSGVCAPMRGMLVAKVLRAMGLHGPAPLLPRPAGEAKMLEGHRVLAVIEHGIFQPDVTKYHNLGLVEETEGL